MILEQRQIEGLRIGIVSKICTPEFRHVTDCLDTIDALTQTIAELTAKLDAVRVELGKLTEIANLRDDDGQYVLGIKFSVLHILSILDAPTKPKEARNE